MVFARIQALRAEGQSFAQIASTLNTEGVPSRGGQPWGKSLVGWFLKRYGTAASPESEAGALGVGG